MGENAPAVLAPATRATRDVTETFIPVQYGAGSYVRFKATLKAQWNDTPPSQDETSTDAGSA